MTSSPTLNSPLNFSLPDLKDKIFLHAIDANFENIIQEISLEIETDHEQDDIGDVNVKFLLSLDDDEEINDISTEVNSEGEETIRDSLPLEENKKTVINEVFNFTSGMTIKTEIEKIKEETMKKMKEYHIQMQNKFMMMNQYNQYLHMYKMNYVEMVNKSNVPVKNNLTTPLKPEIKN
jgi:hypothetical protein